MMRGKPQPIITSLYQESFLSFYPLPFHKQRETITFEVPIYLDSLVYKVFVNPFIIIENFLGGARNQLLGLGETPKVYFHLVGEGLQLAFGKPCHLPGDDDGGLKAVLE